MPRKQPLLQTAVVVGSGITISGLMLPLATLPTGETIGLMEANQNFAILLILLSLIAATLGVTKFAKFSWIPALISGLVAAVGLSAAFTKIDAAKREIQSLIESSPFGAIASNLLGTFEIHSYWILIFVGVVVTIVGSFAFHTLKDSSNTKSPLSGA